MRTTTTTETDLQLPKIPYELVASYRHDPKAYTEGLKFYQGSLYESTGRMGQCESTIRRVELKTGNVLERIIVNPTYFAEGLTILNGRGFVLTEDSGVGMIFDPEDLTKPVHEFHNNGWITSWGLTDDGKLLMLSDGTNRLRFIDPVSLQLVGDPLAVYKVGSPLVNLDELEYFESRIYANVLYSDSIFRIDPLNGQVVGEIDLSDLRPPETNSCVSCVLNGIACDRQSGHLFVTGKMWPRLFEIRMID